MKNVRGTIGLVRQPKGIDTAKCQFYINVADNKNLDFQDYTAEKYGYCVFGRVFDAESMAVVDRIAKVEVKDEVDFERIPVTPVTITRVVLR